jgi:hypothetical protein
LDFPPAMQRTPRMLAMVLLSLCMGLDFEELRGKKIIMRGF